MPLILYALAWSLAAWFPLTDADIWWHLASAREMLLQKSLLHSDPFTFTAEGAPWTNIHSLYQLIIYGIYSLGGAGALVVFHSLCYGAGAALWNREAPRSPWLLLFIPLLWAVQFLLMARPLAWTLLLLALQFRVYHAPWRRAVRLGVLVFLQVLLANSQGLFLLGPILIFLYAVRERKPFRQNIFGFTALTLASAIHPEGFRVLIYPWKLLLRLSPGNLFASRMSENISPWKALFGSGNLMEFFQAAALLIFTVLFVCFIGRKRSEWRTSLLILPWLILAWLAGRNIPVLFMIALPLLAAKLPEWPHSFGKYLSYLLFAALFIAQWQWWRVNNAPVAPFRTPENAARFLENHPVQNTRLFSEIRYGSYLAWRLPGVKTFVDGRLILRDAEFFSHYLSLEQKPENFETLPMRNTFDFALIPAAYPEMFHALAGYLAASPGWRLVYFDETAWLFARPETALEDLRTRPEVRDSAYLEFQTRMKDENILIQMEGEYFWHRAARLFEI